MTIGGIGTNQQRWGLKHSLYNRKVYEMIRTEYGF